MDLQTRLIHAGEQRIEGAVVLPVFQSSTYVSQDEQDYDAIRYLRLNNTPNHRALHAKLAAACGGEDALVAGSGMAAITTALMTFLNNGDHLLIQDCLYGGTHSFVTQDAPADGDELRLYRRQRAGDVGGQAPSGDPGDLRGDHDEPAIGSRRSGGRGGIRPGVRAGLPDRQYLCVPVQLPAAGNRVRYRTAQRDQVPEWPFGPRRRARLWARPHKLRQSGTS